MQRDLFEIFLSLESHNIQLVYCKTYWTMKKGYLLIPRSLVFCIVPQIFTIGISRMSPTPRPSRTLRIWEAKWYFSAAWRRGGRGDVTSSTGNVGGCLWIVFQNTIHIFLFAEAGETFSYHSPVQLWLPTVLIPWDFKVELRPWRRFRRLCFLGNILVFEVLILLEQRWWGFCCLYLLSWEWLWLTYTASLY